MDDSKSVSRLKQGDLGGLKDLVLRYQARAVHSAYLILFDRALAEDVAQSAFVKVAESIHQFDETRGFGPWFFRIVINDSLKLAARHKRVGSLDDPVDPSLASLAERLTDPGLQPEQVLMRKETREMVIRAVESLPPGQRAAIVMRYYLDMSMTDMSHKTGRPVSTIKWWLRDARRRLRALVETPQSS